MPTLQNAKKALRKSEKRFERKKRLRAEIASLRRSFRKLLEAGKIDEAKKMMPKMDKVLDKAVTKSIFKKNKSSRIKSRLRKALQRAEK